MKKREPDFTNLLDVLNCKKPSRPTLFEFFMNDTVYSHFAGRPSPMYSDVDDRLLFLVEAFASAGYDYTTTPASNFAFPVGSRAHAQTSSLNEGATITDWDSYESYTWPEVKDFDTSRLKSAVKFLPDGMKLVVNGPGGVLENVISLTGYDNLCLMIYDDPDLVKAVFDSVGSRLVEYYLSASGYESVGAFISNDDWGFKTQTMLSAEDMRKYVFPWHKKIAKVCHDAKKPVILHSCGYAEEIMEDIINMPYDGKHSYEDAICPVEKVYGKYAGRIGIMGGIDLDFVIRSPIEDLKKRCRDMLSLAEDKGGFALGTGNSVPEYVPLEKYIAMISTVFE